MRNRDDFTYSNWVGSTHPVAAKHPRGIVKVLKKMPMLARQKLQAEPPVRLLSPAVHCLLQKTQMYMLDFCL